MQEENVKLLPVNYSSTLDKILDYMPDLFNKIEKKISKETETKAQINNILKQDREEKTKNNTKKIKEEQYKVEYQEHGNLDD